MIVSKSYYYTVTLSPLLWIFCYLIGFTAVEPQTSWLHLLWYHWFYFLGTFFLVITLVTQLILWYHAWCLVQYHKDQVTPLYMVLFNFIPVFNIYWVFVLVWGFAKKYNRFVFGKGETAKSLPERNYLWVIVLPIFAIVMLGFAVLLADEFTVEALEKLDSRNGIKLTLLGGLYYSFLISISIAAIILWINVTTQVCNVINFKNTGPKLIFPWSLLSVPSVIVVWIFWSYMLPDFLLPQVWFVIIEGYRASCASVTEVMSSSVYEFFCPNVKTYGGPTLLNNIVASLREELFGFGAAVIVSLICGFLAGFYRGFREYIVPLNGLFMSIPPIAWAPLMMLFFGLPSPDDWFPLSIIAVIFIAAVNPMIITIIEGVLQIQGTEIKAARVLGAKSWRLFGYIYLPSSLPFITTALRIGFSQAWRALVAAEMIGAVAGIGWMVSNSGEVGDHALMLLGIAMIGGLSWLFERLLFRPLEKHYEVWRLA